MAFVAFFWFEKNLAVLTSEQGYVVNLVFVSIPRKEKRIVFRLFYFIFKVLWKFTSVFSKPLVPHKVCIDNCHHRSVCNPGYNWKEKTWAVNQIIQILTEKNCQITAVEEVILTQKMFAKFFGPRMFVRSETILWNIYYTFLMQGKALELTFLGQGQTFM